MRPELEKLLPLARSLHAEEVDEFVGDLERIKICALSILMKPVVNPPDELLDAKQLAARLGTSVSFVYHNLEKYKSFAKHQGRAKRWSANGLARYMKK